MSPRSGLPNCRAIARQFGHSLRKIRAVLKEPEPCGYTRSKPPAAPKLGSFVGRIDEILKADELLPTDVSPKLQAPLRRHTNVLGLPSRQSIQVVGQVVGAPEDNQGKLAIGQQSLRLRGLPGFDPVVVQDDRAVLIHGIGSFVGCDFLQRRDRLDSALHKQTPGRAELPKVAMLLSLEGFQLVAPGSWRRIATAGYSPPNPLGTFSTFSR